MNIRIGIVAVLSVLTSLVTGCGGGGSGDDGAQTDDQAPEALSANQALSPDLLCAAVKAANDNADGSTGLKSIKEADLKGDSLKDFKSFQKTMLPDFPSQAWNLPVKLGSKTFTFVLVTENNDGGQSIGVYRTDGSTVATVMNSESENGTWGPAPADKCPE